MYHLRTIDEEGISTTSELGRTYAVHDKEKNDKSFSNIVEKTPAFKEGIGEDVYAFVTAGHLIYSLKKESQAYIMTDNGGTISNLTHKG